jgi:hypothetical protein
MIELERALGLPDGQEVTITMEPAIKSATLPPGEGLRRAFGGWAEDAAELEGFLEQVRRDREDRRPAPNE